jgi:hypothetical protein
VKFAAVRNYAMLLPDVSEEPHHEYGSYRVRGKIFLTVPPGEEFIHVFVPGDLREHALAVYGAFSTKLLWGGKVRGLRIRLADAAPAAVELLVKQAWAFKAPRLLAGEHKQRVR